MSTCFETQKIEGLSSKDDDVDLASLIEQIESGNDESSQTDLSSSSAGGDAHTMNESSDSTASVDEEVENSFLMKSTIKIEEKEDIKRSSTPKPGFFEKRFLKSLPVAILAKRKLFGSNSDIACSATHSPVHSLPLTPRTPRRSFELSAHRKVDRSSSCKVQRPDANQMTWNIWVSDLGISKVIEVPHSSTCAILLHKLLAKLQRKPDLTQWSLFEQNSETMIERFVEDNELMDDVLTNQQPEDISRFCLNRSPEKYSILQHPEVCLPNDMLTLPPNSYSIDDSPDTVKRLQMQHILTKTAPELCGWLHVREVGRTRVWKKVYCVLRNSGLYFSTKGTSKDPQHLVCIAEVHSAKVWFPINNKKHSNNAPTTFCFCLKPMSCHQETIIRWFCSETNHLRSAWISGLRLTMNGSRFHQSYLSARRSGSTNLICSSSDRAINKYDANFVAMDFSGATGRVIKDPKEVAMVELEKQSSWRRRLINRSLNSPSSGMERGVSSGSAPTKEVTYFTKAIHVTQPWFYGKISRETACDEIQRHGCLDGTFLVRESSSISGGIVITVCQHQKSRHIPVTMLERNGQHFYTSDNGDTRFLDLIQLIDFHRLNKGSLPCPLLHECARSSA